VCVFYHETSSYMHRCTALHIPVSTTCSILVTVIRTSPPQRNLINLVLHCPFDRVTVTAITSSLLLLSRSHGLINRHSPRGTPFYMYIHDLSISFSAVCCARFVTHFLLELFTRFFLVPILRHTQFSSLPEDLSFFLYPSPTSSLHW
jgi:hypothetical protein